MIIYKSLRPWCFGRGLPIDYVVVCKPSGLDDIRCVWELDDEPQCTLQISKVEGMSIMGNYATHSLKHVGRSESFGFSSLSLSNVIISFLPPNVKNVVQPLVRGIIALFKVLYEKKLLEWVLSQFDSPTTHHDLKKIVHNVRHAIMWCLQV